MTINKAKFNLFTRLAELHFELKASGGSCQRVQEISAQMDLIKGFISTLNEINAPNNT